MENLPSEIQWNIIKFMRHPTAEIVMQSPKYKNEYYRSVRKHGDAYDRGESDAYYYRDKKPHKVIDRVKDDRGRYYDIRVDDLTPDELEAYDIGYAYMDDRKYKNNILKFYYVLGNTNYLFLGKK